MKKALFTTFIFAFVFIGVASMSNSADAAYCYMGGYSMNSCSGYDPRFDTSLSSFFGNMFGSVYSNYGNYSNPYNYSYNNYSSYYQPYYQQYYYPQQQYYYYPQQYYYPNNYGGYFGVNGNGGWYGGISVSVGR